MSKYLGLILSIIAIAIAVWAGLTARAARKIALSSVKVMETNTLMTPVFDEAANKMGFLAIYELALTNTGRYDIVLENIDQVVEGTGFIVFLKSGSVIAPEIEHLEFLVDPTISEIQQNPKLIKALFENKMAASHMVNLPVEKNKTRFVRLGLYFLPYDANGQPLADSALISFQLFFSNGTSELIRQAINFPTLMPPAPR